jgi:hypothetical protein
MKTWKDVIYFNNIIIRPASIFANFIVHLNTKYGTQLNANFYITKYENTNFEINEPTKFHRTTKIGIHKNKNIHSIIQISHSNSMTKKKIYSYTYSYLQFLSRYAMQWPKAQRQAQNNWRQNCSEKTWELSNTNLS